MNNKLWLFCVLIFLADGAWSAAGCSGRFPNPLTDTCWGCIFPINIAGAIVTGGEAPNHDIPPPPVCTCPAPPPIFQRPGVGFSIWEAWRLMEVVRAPGCFPTLNGMRTAMWGAEGTHNANAGDNGNAYYHIHMYSYPVLSLVFGAIIDTICFQTTSISFDMLYMTEVDPLWADDDTASIFSPEVFLFNNPLSQAACIADTVSATSTNFGLDTLYWCSGSQGSTFPLSAAHSNHIGGIDSSLAKLQSFLFKLQRHALLLDTSSTAAMCQPFPMVPTLFKNQFKQQSMLPVPQPLQGIGLGKPSQFWATGFEFPSEGEDFTYLFWRKRKCCAF